MSAGKVEIDELLSCQQIFSLFGQVCHSMKTIEAIRLHLEHGQFEFSMHAFKRAVERNISETEIREIAANALIIEDYPDDKYIPSCLLLGFTRLGKPLHLQVTRAETSKGLIKIVTLYQPSEEEWINFSKRR